MSEPDIKPQGKAAAKAVAAPRALQARRRFLRSVALAAGVTAAAMAGYIPTLGAKPLRLRPPGALEEDDLLASCIKCGQCVQVCPVRAIRLDDIDSGFGVGVPYIAARDQACDFSCDAVQCILACPTGALTYNKPAFFEIKPGAVLAAAPVLKAKEHDAEPTLNLKERIGVARLARPEACLAVQGKGFKGQARGAAFRGRMRYMDVDRWKPISVSDHPYDLPLCDLCVRECPVTQAISIEARTGADGVQRMTPVVHEPCVGCGVCEMICPVEPTAIVVDAQAVWRAQS